MTLSANELAQLRAAQEAMLPDTAYILSLTRVSDGMGGGTATWGTAGTADCRIEAMAGSERYSGDKRTAFARYVVTVPYDTTVNEANRVKISDVTFHILNVNSSKSWPTVKRLEVERVDNG